MKATNLRPQLKLVLIPSLKVNYFQLTKFGRFILKWDNHKLVILQQFIILEPAIIPMFQRALWFLQRNYFIIRQIQE